MEILTYVPKPKEGEIKAFHWNSTEQIIPICEKLNGEHFKSEGKNYIEFSPFNNEATRTAEMGSYFIYDEEKNGFVDIPAESFEEGYISKYMTPNKDC